MAKKPANKTASEIIREYLERAGYDGLVNPDQQCGCPAHALCPCDSNPFECRAGHLCIRKTACNGCDPGSRFCLLPPAEQIKREPPEKSVPFASELPCAVRKCHYYDESFQQNCRAAAKLHMKAHGPAVCEKFIPTGWQKRSANQLTTPRT